MTAQIVQQAGPFLAYGYWEARIRLKRLAGAIDAFWLLNADGTRPPEIDYELRFDANGGSTVNQALIYGPPEDQHNHQNYDRDLTEWHTFGYDIRPDVSSFFIDGSPVWTHDTPAGYDKPKMILLSAQAGNWASNIDSSQLPGVMEIDYVHVYSVRPF